MLTVITNDDGYPLKAKVEVLDGEIILHSRGGAEGKPNHRNPDYRKALRAILERLSFGGLVISGIWLDSRIARQWPENERLLLAAADLDAPVDDLLTRLAGLSAAKGRADNVRSHGNSTKRLRIGIPGASQIALQQAVSTGRSETAWSAGGATSASIADEEREWAEGSVRRIAHLRRERASGLAKAKKQAFVAEHGHLFCERCALVPSRELGEHGDACIEVHHHSTALADMDGSVRTKLSDLRCLCANCHRIVHRERFG